MTSSGRQSTERLRGEVYANGLKPTPNWDGLRSDWAITAGWERMRPGWLGMNWDETRGAEGATDRRHRATLPGSERQKLTPTTETRRHGECQKLFAAD